VEESNDYVLVSRKDLERLQQVVRTTKYLLPEILDRDLLTAAVNAQALELGELVTIIIIIIIITTTIFIVLSSDSEPLREFTRFTR